MPSVLIVGSSRGLGWVWVNYYKQEGYQIIATTKDKEKAFNLEAILDEQDILLEMDVTKPDSVKAAMGQIEVIPDLIIYNAGTKGYTKDPSGRTTVFNAVLDVDGEASMEAGLLEAFQVNAFGFHRVMHALKEKLVNSSSTVVYITSGVANYNESGGYPNYRESKITGERYTQSWDLALMERSSSISKRPRVFALLPGIVNTGMGAGFTNIDPSGRVKEMADVIIEVSKTGDTFGVWDYKGAKFVGYGLPDLLVKKHYKKEIEGDVKPKHRTFVAKLLMRQKLFTPKLKQGEIDDPNFIKPDLGEHTGDLHNHLNGSFSIEYLKKTAEKNNCVEVYEELVNVRENYLQRTNHQPENGFSAELIGLIWKQFGLIHKIIQNLTDISDGVLDVVQNSTAKYLEIRTTPKPMAKESRDRYIDAFESGLVQANQTIDSKKAVGLLSLDRTIHTLEDAKHFINRIISSPHKVLAGLDISGNPLSTRTLTGDELGKVIHLVLNSGTAIAIHMGESDSDIEKQDTDIILSALEEWKSLNPNPDKNSLHGRIRLGHCIFLTVQQKERIASLGAPIEICPSCHIKLNWHLEKLPHPATDIYNDLSNPIVGGTDDKTIFRACAKTEFNNLLRFFSNTKQLNRKELKEHQASFRFST